MQSPIPAEQMPKHVAIIMDGNGRWAKARRQPRAFGHRAGVEALRAVIRNSSDWGVSALTLYAFSTENWKRPEDEVSALMSLLVEFFTREIDELHRENVRIRIIGRHDGLPEKPRNAVIRAMERTKDNTGLTLSIALNYGGRDEIIRACSKLMKRATRGEIRPEELTREMFARELDTGDLPDVDLLIRTSGELRVSNFLLYQIAYAEMIFTDVFWPDFTEAEYAKALETYAARGRRFGGI